jgi:hypothetical protein
MSRFMVAKPPDLISSEKKKYTESAVNRKPFLTFYKGKYRVFKDLLLFVCVCVCERVNVCHTFCEREGGVRHTEHIRVCCGAVGTGSALQAERSQVGFIWIFH